MLTYLADKKTIVSSTKLSDELGIPQPFVQRIGRMFKKEGYIDILLGLHGGLVLVKNPNEVSVYDIIMIMERSIKINHCLEDPEACSRKAAADCCVRDFFEELQKFLEETVKTKTLADFLEDAKMRTKVRSATS